MPSTYARSSSPVSRDVVERIVTGVRDAVLTKTLPTAQLGLATALGCVLRSAGLLDRVMTLTDTANPDGVGLLIRGAFETSVQGLWMLVAPQNVFLLYSDYQRSSRQLLQGAREEGEIDATFVDAAIAAIDSNLPDKRLPSFDSILTDVNRWATEQQISELVGFDQMYRRLYRPLSLFDVHGFGPVHRYMSLPGPDQPISFLAAPDPFMAPDEIALVFAGLLAEISIVIFREAGIDPAPLESLLPDALELAHGIFDDRSEILARLTGSNLLQ
jgi:Family of unknown function (DUF5677)